MVELPPEFSYVGSAMVTYTKCGWWVVSLTDMIEKTASFILQEMYEYFRIWALSPDTTRFSDSDLIKVLGNQVNVY